MKYVILSFAVAFSFLGSFAQQDFTLIEDAIKSRKRTGKIVYLDTSITFFSPFSQLVKQGKIRGYRDTMKVFMLFSKKEVTQIDNEFIKTRSVALANHLFSNSVSLHFDSLKVFSEKGKGPAYFEEHYARQYFLFSLPIFSRNKTIAIFRLVEMVTPSSGYDYLYFYRKNQGTWIQAMVIRTGAW